jgi:hypothetical protein
MISVLRPEIVFDHIKIVPFDSSLTFLITCVFFFLLKQKAMDVTKMQLQLVGVAAMFVACKYEEMYVPAIDDFVYMTDNTYTKSEIRQMEISILKTMDFML